MNNFLWKIILLTCRTGKETKNSQSIAFVFYLFIATPLTSPFGTNGVICYVLIYLIFEQDENKTQQIEEQNLTKVTYEKFSIIKFLHFFLMY